MTAKNNQALLSPMTPWAVAQRLLNYNKWRSGADGRTMDEAGVVPRQVSIDIAYVCERLLEMNENQQNIKKGQE